MKATLEAPQTTATPTPAPARGGLKKVSFGKAPVKKEETKTKYPEFQGDSPEQAKNVAAIAARIRQRTEELDALQGALETDKAELRMLVGPFYFQHNHGKHDVPSSIAVNSEAGEVLVTFQNRYKKITSEEPISALLGSERTERFFRQAFQLKINGELLPTDQAQEIVDTIITLLGQRNASEALEISEEIKPTKEFHAARHLELTVKENVALEQIAPIVTMVKTKGRGSLQTATIPKTATN